jgi:sterol desaturase/sphingolipid hydroxylase (fatty acid hydroxylase superfamily)
MTLLLIYICRAFASLCVLFVLKELPRFDALLSSAWSTLRQSDVVQLESFEPILASASFALWLNLFRVCDALPALRRFRLEPQSSPVDWSTFDGHHLLSALVAYLLPLALFDLCFPRRVLPSEAPTVVQVVGGVAGALVVYDFLFFWIHLAFHKSPSLYRLHRVHHQQKTMRAAETLRLGFVDGALQVLCSIAALHIVRAHPLTRAVFNCVITFLLCEIHSGFDFPWALHNLVPFGLCGGPVAHTTHHRHGKTHFQQFFTHLDHLLL